MTHAAREGKYHGLGPQTMKPPGTGFIQCPVQRRVDDGVERFRRPWPHGSLHTNARTSAQVTYFNIFGPRLALQAAEQLRSINADCNDSEPCTTDTCYNGDTYAAYCDNVWPACGPSDGCCGPACTPATDPDCPCLSPGAPCTENTECCSLKCLGNGTCK